MNCAIKHIPCKMYPNDKSGGHLSLRGECDFSTGKYKKCDSGWLGENCDIRNIKNGILDKQTGEVICQKGWRGIACEKKQCQGRV